MPRPDRIPVKCPNCGTGLRAPLEFAGKRATCRNCKGKVPIPALVEPEFADPVIEAEPVDADVTEAMVVEEFPQEYEAKPPPKLPPRDDPEPDEDEDEERPHPKRRRRADDEDEDRPKRSRPRDDEVDRPRRSLASKNKKPVWTWIAGGAGLLLVGIISAYLLFGVYRGKPITVEDLEGEWVGEAGDVHYYYTFNKNRTGRVTAEGRGLFVGRFFNFNVENSGGRPRIWIQSGTEHEDRPASLDDDGNLTLGASFQGLNDLSLRSESIVLTRTKPEGGAVATAKEDPGRANDRTLAALQGRWWSTRMWDGGGSPSGGGAPLGAATSPNRDATSGGQITIDGKTFRQQQADKPDAVSTITKLIESPSLSHSEMELTFEIETDLGFHPRPHKVWRCKFQVGEDWFNLMRIAPEVDFATQTLPLIPPGQRFMTLESGVRVDSCIRAK